MAALSTGVIAHSHSQGGTSVSRSRHRGRFCIYSNTYLYPCSHVLISPQRMAGDDASLPFQWGENHVYVLSIDLWVPQALTSPGLPSDLRTSGTGSQQTISDRPAIHYTPLTVLTVEDSCPTRKSKHWRVSVAIHNYGLTSLDQEAWKCPQEKKCPQEQ